MSAVDRARLRELAEAAQHSYGNHSYDELMEELGSAVPALLDALDAAEALLNEPQSRYEEGALRYAAEQKTRAEKAEADFAVLREYADATVEWLNAERAEVQRLREGIEALTNTPDYQSHECGEYQSCGGCVTDDLRDLLDPPTRFIDGTDRIDTLLDEKASDAKCLDHRPRCQYISPTPWGPSQCALPDGHDGRHAYSPSESLFEKTERAGPVVRSPERTTDE